MSHLKRSIRLYPDRPHWSEWYGKAMVLLTSEKHHGAVLNMEPQMQRENVMHVRATES
jgi:hypothetical protein